jgi:Protein of unknown function, DUF547
MKKLCQAAVFLSSLLLAACTTVPRPSLPARSDSLLASPPYEAWARVLQTYVDAEGRVDFAGIAAHRADLDRFVAYIYDNGPTTQPQLFATADAVMAYHLNAYNALAMSQVINWGIPKTLKGFAKVKFFYLHRVQVDGRRISLYAYENDVIRTLADPRVHFALNCMSVSCPRLPREPFLEKTLDAQLDSATRQFFSETRNANIDATTGSVRLSEILKFFREDFLAHAPSLPAYINRYRAMPLPETIAIEFSPYDWTINRQPGT